ncbi:hypothetical protein [Rufibacter sp. LB8]|uniref:hypothetical protein n=1 Tax=Rufibacter sp. LB8 TaxID=2777781 RepID=UPI00178C34A8|nr:hypothetical protein [Rufibacter sp. LB8]
MKKSIIRAVVGILCLYGLAQLFFTDQPTALSLGSTAFFGERRLLQNPPDSVWATAGLQYKISKVGAFFLGKHYRQVWATPVKAKVFHMNEQQGGLRIEKLGGGMQTTSLTLTDSLGRRFTLRSVDKDPISVLPPFWRKTFVGAFVRDQVSATNPYAALVVAPLAEAAGVFHPTPHLVFVLPTDQDFKQYAHLVGNKLFLMEEKFTTRASLTKKFGQATDLVDTETMLSRHYRSPNHRIDQWAYARARLLDLLLSDWDRHEGQWDWAEYHQGPQVLYKPIPKDRDQALCHYDDGVIPWLATRKFAARKFESFHPEFKDVFGLTINASFIDQRALAEVSIADFRRLARELQLALSDSVLRAAVKEFPKPVYDLVGQQTYQTLKSRLARLPQAAEEYYRVLAKHVLVAGSDERERFVVHRLSQGRTVVEVFALKENGVNGEKLFSRTFFANETDKISLYGLGQDDVFVLRGTATEGSYVHIFGGSGLDEVTDASTVKGWRKKTIVEDSAHGVLVQEGPETESRISAVISEVPVFVRHRER